MRRLMQLAMAIICLCIPLGLLAEDWPQFLGPHGNSISSETGINKDWAQKPPQVLWTVPLTDNGYSGPSVADGKVFINDHQGNQDIVRALNLQTGAEVWRYVYEGTDKANGGQFGFTNSTPVIDQDRVYTLSHLGLLNCLKLKTGEVIWSRNILTDFGGKLPGWRLAISPYIDGKKLIVIPGGPNAAVAALDKLTGKTIWQGGGSDEPGYATPTVATITGKRQYVCYMASSLIGVDTETGTQLWSVPWSTGSNVNAPAPQVIGDSVFITASYGHGCALVDVTKDGATIRWQNKEIQSHFNSPVVLNGLIYSTTDPGRLVCLDPKDGTVKWAQRGFEKGGLVAVDGTLIVCDGRTGEVVMVAVDPTAYQELGRIKPLDGQSWTAPIVSNGKLIVRNRTALACIDLKK